MNEPYNEILALEKAAIMLFNQGFCDQAAALFGSLVTQRPSYSMGWYGLSSSFLNFAGERGEVEGLQTAYTFGLRALQEDSKNRYALELLAWMRENTPLREMGINHLSSYPSDPVQVTGKLLSANRLIEAFQCFSDWGERMKLILFLGDQNSAEFVPLLLYALEYDENADVRMAVMKRLSDWGNYPEVQKVCKRIALTDKWLEIEPYFTMGLLGMETEWSNEFLKQNPTPFYQQFQAH